jgi:hypothetical protein
VPREAAVREARRRLHTRRSGQRGAQRRPRPALLKVADVALFYGERSGGIRTYLDAKVAWARDTAAYYDPLTGQGLGARNFGWSTLLIDLLRG